MAADESKYNPEAPHGLADDMSKVRLEEPEDGVFEAYANIVNMNWTLTEVRLRFAELIQVPDEGQPTWDNQHAVLLERAAISLPWWQAKVLRGLLDGIVKNYEAINGELKLPKLPNRPPAS
jgi:hypothetical protein